jgi:phosphate starvation-inducible protein PhoH
VVDSRDVAEQISEIDSNDHFRRIAAIYIGVVAMLLSIATLGGSDAMEERLNANIHASDTYAFYQAKYIRQVMLQSAAQELEVLAVGLNLTPEQREKVQQVVQRNRDTVQRYESEPTTNEGKKELLSRAKEFENVRDKAAAQAPNFDYAEALFQIAIVLGSVAIVAVSPWLLGLSSLLTIAGVAFTINGYLLLV